MLYNSTRGNDKGRSSAYVIKNGIAADGGLFVPESIPSLTKELLEELKGMNYPQRAEKILSMFLTDYSTEELKKATETAYSKERFGKVTAPIAVSGGNSILELWHGPTSAFKDMALQIMPHLLSLSLDKCGEEKDALILVATSGDTGKAALAGYANVPRVRIQVFYPSEGVSPVQKLQMATQEGNNVSVCGIKGNFDDAQSAVKRIFGGNASEKIAENGLFFSSANSINWGRLAPQIVYYISAYLDMVSAGTIAMGDKINVTVPTGNFGNILAAYIAKQMGLPVNKMICASNKNNILTDFFNTGVYDKRRPFYTTSSPSMDILISSNLERLLYFVLGAEKCAELMKELNEKGIYTVDEATKAKLSEDFAALYGDESATEETVARYFESGYLCDPHTAVALYCADKYKAESGDNTPMLVASTASPYKFPRAVLKSLGKNVDGDDFTCIDTLSEISNTCPPKALAELKGKPVRFDGVTEKADIDTKVYDFAAKKL